MSPKKSVKRQTSSQSPFHWGGTGGVKNIEEEPHMVSVPFSLGWNPTNGLVIRGSRRSQSPFHWGWNLLIPFDFLFPRKVSVPFSLGWNRGKLCYRGRSDRVSVPFSLGVERGREEAQSKEDTNLVSVPFSLGWNWIL